MSDCWATVDLVDLRDRDLVTVDPVGVTSSSSSFSSSLTGGMVFFLLDEGPFFLETERLRDLVEALDFLFGCCFSSACSSSSSGSS